MKEFFNLWCLVAVFIFALNNLVLKWEFHNWLTGKLSDFMACFFLPLLISGILGLFSNSSFTQQSFKGRLLAGSVITAVCFSSVKIFDTPSLWMNEVFSYLLKLVSNSSSINRVDPTDLIALPVIFLAYFYGISQYKRD